MNFNDFVISNTQSTGTYIVSEYLIRNKDISFRIDLLFKNLTYLARSTSSCEADSLYHRCLIINLFYVVSELETINEESL